MAFGAATLLSSIFSVGQSPGNRVRQFGNLISTGIPGGDPWGNHQVLTLAKISEIPMGRELMEDLKEEVMEVDRTFSKTLGVAEMITGIALLSFALFLV